MRLKCIRLAGFKSFVDPTVLLLPGPIISVVGPNGCGKSTVGEGLAERLIALYRELHASA